MTHATPSLISTLKVVYPSLAMIVRLVQAMQKEFRENTPKSISNLQAYSGEDGMLEEQKSLKE